MQGFWDMIEIDFSSYDLNSPRDRRALLLKIPPSREVVKKYHPELLDLFRREMSIDALAAYGGHPSAYLKSDQPTVQGFGTLMQNFRADHYSI